MNNLRDRTTRKLVVLESLNSEEKTTKGRKGTEETRQSGSSLLCRYHTTHGASGGRNWEAKRMRASGAQRIISSRGQEKAQGPQK